MKTFKTDLPADASLCRIVLTEATGPAGRYLLSASLTRFGGLNVVVIYTAGDGSEGVCKFQGDNILEARAWIAEHAALPENFRPAAE